MRPPFSVTTTHETALRSETHRRLTKRLLPEIVHARDRPSRPIDDVVSVVRLKPGPSDLAAKDRQLVPEHEDLQLLGSVAAPDEHDQLQHTVDDSCTGLTQAKATSRGRR